MSSQRTRSENTGQATVVPRARRWLTMKLADFDQGLQSVLLSHINCPDPTEMSWYPPFMELEEIPYLPRSLATRLSANVVSKYNAFVTPPATSQLPLHEAQRGQWCNVTLAPHANPFQVTDETWSALQLATQRYPKLPVRLAVIDKPQAALQGMDGVTTVDSADGRFINLPLTDDASGNWHFTGFFGDYTDCWLQVGSSRTLVQTERGMPLKVGVRFCQKDVVEGGSDFQGTSF